MAPFVLVVEDDEAIGASLERALAATGYATRVARSLGQAREAAACQAPDLVLLDLTLPDGDGLDLCMELHRARPGLPIIILTARTEEVDVVVGLNSGAVDYVAKPFRLAELLARAHAQLRQNTSCAAGTAGSAGTAGTAGTAGSAGTAGGAGSAGTVRSAGSAGSGGDRAGLERIVVGDLELDIAAHRVHVAGREIALRPREFDLIVRLARDAGRVVTREQLMSDVWDEHWWGSTKTLDVHLNALRRKLGEPAGERSRITAIRRVGYRLELPAGAQNIG